MKKPTASMTGALKREFEKDLELFQYILVLLNDASAIRNVELMWAEDLDIFESEHPIAASTGEALVQLNAVGRTDKPRAAPSSPFCDLVHGFGDYVEQTCAKSDDPAKQRCRANGCSDVYRCHVGLTDIAVPVICENRYLGTLFSGQVLTEPPTAEGFAHVRAALAGQPHVDIPELENAYFKVPVVTSAQLTQMVRMLEVFARYISNAWKRLQLMSEFQRLRQRELVLDRRELVALLLSGQISDEANLTLLVRKAGLRQIPTHVLVLRLSTSLETCAATPFIGRYFMLDRISHIVEDVCRIWPDALVSAVVAGELCILAGHEFRNSGHERNWLESMAEALLCAVRTQGIGSARIGISATHSHPHELLGAYNEACSALESGHGPVSFFAPQVAPEQQPSEALSHLIKALQSAKGPEAATAAVHNFLAQTVRTGTAAGQLQQSRGLLTWACEHVALEIISLGAQVPQVQAAKEKAIGVIVGSASPLAMTGGFRRFIEEIRQELVRSFSQHEEKIVMEVHRLVRELNPAHVTIQDVSVALNISTGHLSRVYSRKTGMTLEEYLIRQRVEIAKRRLLDPRLNVAQIAYSCGFCNPAYFSSVFRKYMKCTPRQYARQPQIWNDRQNESFAGITVGRLLSETTAAAVGSLAEGANQPKCAL